MLIVQHVLKSWMLLLKDFCKIAIVQKRMICLLLMIVG